MKPLAEVLRANGITHTLTPAEADPAILTLIVGGDAAVPMWRKLRSLVAKTAHWPVILGDPHDARDMLSDNLESNPEPVAAVLSRAASLNLHAWMREQRTRDRENFAAPDEGAWPTAPVEKTTRFTLPYDILTGRPKPAILIALIPTMISNEVPAHLRVGNWNTCPEAAVHVAFAAHWHQQYGAEIVGISRDILEMTVPRPPTTREQAVALAREQYTYCFDIVDQGVETIANLAASLLGSSQWYFWWD